jgi:hypothetical protein
MSRIYYYKIEHKIKELPEFMRHLSMKKKLLLWNAINGFVLQKN